MKLIKNLMAVSLMAAMCACSHKPADNLVGNDRDDHGCMASAGYRWSEARKDCIRIWEAGERLENGERNVFVVFSNDSTIAEVYLGDGRCITCKKKNNSWKSVNDKVSVHLNNGTLAVFAEGVEYKKNDSE